MACANSHKSIETHEELKFSLDDYREFQGPNELNTLRDAWNQFHLAHKDEPWAGAMVDNYRRELLALHVAV